MSRLFCKITSRCMYTIFNVSSVNNGDLQTIRSHRTQRQEVLKCNLSTTTGQQY